MQPRASRRWLKAKRNTEQPQEMPSLMRCPSSTSSVTWAGPHSAGLTCVWPERNHSRGVWMCPWKSSGAWRFAYRIHSATLQSRWHAVRLQTRPLTAGLLSFALGAFLWLGHNQDPQLAMDARTHPPLLGDHTLARSNLRSSPPLSPIQKKSIMCALRGKHAGGRVEALAEKHVSMIMKQETN